MNIAIPLLMFGVGLYMMLRLHQLKKHGVPVKMKVIKQSIDWGPNTAASPVFEIVSEEYKGEIAKSEIGLSFGIHSVGSIVQGLYHPVTGTMESQTTLGIWRFFTWLIVLGSAGFLIWCHVVKSLL